MKLSAIILSLSLITSLQAASSGHRAAAEQVVKIISGPEVLTESVSQVLDPFLNQLRENGMPERLSAEVKQAFLDWVAQDIQWPEIAPALIDLYTKQFTELELNQIADFYETTAGKKTLKLSSELNAAANTIRERYAHTKQAALMKRIQPIVERYEAELSAASKNSK